MDFSHKFGLGTAQFGLPYGISNHNGQTLPDEVSSILTYARNRGILTIDTASAYGNSEEILGRNNLETFKIVSKFMPPSDGMSISNQLSASLSKLNIERLYGYLAHRPLDLARNRAHWEELKELKILKKINKIGYSLNTVEELEILLEQGMFPDLVQIPYNYFDNRFRDRIVKLKSMGCEVHARSPFLQGLFFIKPNDMSPFFDEVRGIIEDLQLKFKTNLPGVLLKYVLSLNFIDCVIMGVENTSQLIENLNSVNIDHSILDNKNRISDSILMPLNWPK